MSKLPNAGSTTVPPFGASGLTYPNAEKFSAYLGESCRLMAELRVMFNDCSSTAAFTIAAQMLRNTTRLSFSDSSNLFCANAPILDLLNIPFKRPIYTPNELLR